MAPIERLIMETVVAPNGYWGWAAPPNKEITLPDGSQVFEIRAGNKTNKPEFLQISRLQDGNINIARSSNSIRWFYRVRHKDGDRVVSDSGMDGNLQPEVIDRTAGIADYYAAVTRENT